MRAAVLSIRGTEGLSPSVLSLARLGIYNPHSRGRVHSCGLVRCDRFLVRAAVWCIRDRCIWPAGCSPSHVFSYASLGDLSVRLLRGYEGLESDPLVLYKNITRRCCCLLCTRHLWYTRLLNLARGGLSMSRVSYASLLICPYCCLEVTRYSNLFRLRHCSCVCTALWRIRGTRIWPARPLLVSTHRRVLDCLWLSYRGKNNINA